MSVVRFPLFVMFSLALATASSAAGQTAAAAQSSQTRLEIQGEYGGHYWIVETAPDGSRRGAWISKQTPLDRVDRSALQPIPALPTAPASPMQGSPEAGLNERLARIERALADLLAGSKAVPNAPPQSVPSAQSAPARDVPQPRPQTSTPWTTEQHGDVAIGYSFMHETDLELPFGVTFSDGFRMHRNVDIVIEGQYAHGTADLIVTDVGVDIWSVLGGVRFSGGSRYGDSVRSFGQFLVGVVGVKGSLGSVASASTTGFGFQPGFGVDVPVTRAVAIRPQFDVLIGRIEGETTKNLRFGVSAVFRLFKNYNR